MFKIENERVVNVLPEEMSETNHIGQFIVVNGKCNRNDFCINELKRLILRGSQTKYVLFEVNNKTYWVKQEEFSLIKFALEEAIDCIILWYVAGSMSPMNNNQGLQTMRSSGIDGYQLNIKYN